MKKSCLPESLRQLMVDQNITTRTLAKKTLVPQSTISAILNGRSTSRQEYLLSIAMYFGVTLERLIFGSDDRHLTLESILTEEVFSGWLRVKVERALPDKKRK